MMQVLARIQKNLEARLLAAGFTMPVLRNLLVMQAGIVLLAFIVGILLVRWTLWPLAFAFGGVLVTVGFAHLSLAAIKLLGNSFSRAAALRLFFGFSVRLLLAGLILFLLIVQWKMPIIPLVFGLSLTPICILVWTIANLGSNTGNTGAK